MPSTYYEDTRATTYSMTRVFGWMFYAILLTAVAAFGLYYGLLALDRLDLYYPILIAGLVAVVVLSFAGQLVIGRTRSKPVAITVFSLFAVAMGIWISPLVILYDLTTMVYALFVTSGIFGIMAVYGAVTKRDLSGFGTFLFMLLMGCLFVSLINLFIGSNTTNWIVSLIVMAVYIGFIAFDVNRVKRLCESNQMNTNLALLMALNLYVDFVYIFIRIVSIIGSSRRN